MRIKLSELEKLPVCTSADLLPFRVEMPDTYHWFPNNSGTVQRVERAILQYHPSVVKHTKKRVKDAPVLVKGGAR